ncbi:hypothetical protein NLG97_g2514 [Lecanicillium saksenae]|uniref:Uncharacterized protein n=1 Tax=Lecanicillium saksenae TaxID=468837 RepID=A0ACC1R4R7_9HYPO|nr:hypothetical protein NLG97_g2514 [Lecanicillium saksenae]
MALPIRSKPGGSDLSGPVDDTGAIIITDTTHRPNSVAYTVSLCGVSSARELSDTQPAFHKAFERRVLPQKLLAISEKLLEMEVEADPAYAGWSPGSTTVSGFGREATYWKQIRSNAGKEAPVEPTWRTATNRPGLDGKFIVQTFMKRQQGLGDDWTEKKGYDQVTELVLRKDYHWMDPEEKYKIRHQIGHLLAAMATTPVLSFETVGSVSTLVHFDRISTDFGFVDLMYQLLKAREVLLRMEKSPSSWYGGISNRILSDLIMADLWTSNFEPSGETTFVPTKNTLYQQFDGLLRFVKEMHWPYEEEVRDAVRQLRLADPAQMSYEMTSWDWVNGMVFPGSFFTLGVVTVITSMSPSLREKGKVLGTTVSVRRGNFGIMYADASYWSSRSIIGKVLAPMASAKPTDKKVRTKCVGGWVGPCPPATFLEGSAYIPDCKFGNIASVDSLPPPSSYQQTPEPGNTNPVNDGDPSGWIEPTIPAPPTDSAKLTALRLTRTSVLVNNQPQGREAVSYQAHLDFQLTKTEATVSATLKTNSIFIAAPPCRGQHRINPQHASKYRFHALNVEGLVEDEDAPPDGRDDAAIIVINTDGAHASEAFARAWCSEEGKDAIIWKRKDAKCCFKCALMLASKDGLGTGVVIIC